MHDTTLRHLNIEEAAAALGVSRRTIERRIRRGELQTEIVAGRRMVIAPVVESDPHSAVELAGFDNIAAFIAYKQHASGPSSSSATTKEEAAKQQGLRGPHSPATALDCFRKCDKELSSCCLCAPK